MLIFSYFPPKPYLIAHILSVLFASLSSRECENTGEENGTDKIMRATIKAFVPARIYNETFITIFIFCLLSLSLAKL